MGTERQYILNLTLESEEYIDIVEEMLQSILMDLYDSGGVEAIHVIDKNNPAISEDMKEAINILNDLEPRDVMYSIEVVREMEDEDE